MRPTNTSPMRVASGVVALVFTLALGACSTDEEPTLEPPPTSEAVPADPVAEAEAAARRLEAAIDALAGRYSFELTVTFNGNQSQHVTGLNLGTSTTTTRVRDGITTETVVIDGASLIRQQGGPWVPSELPTDHDPLAPLLSTAEIAVTGYDVAISYPGRLLGFEVDWVNAAVEVGPDQSITLTSTDGTTEARMVLQVANEGVAIAVPTN